MAVVNVHGAEGGEIVLIGFFIHAVQAGFPRQFGLPMGLALRGCVVALHLLGLPMGFLALLLVALLGCIMGALRGCVVALHLLGPVPMGFLALLLVALLGCIMGALLGCIVGALLGCMVVVLRLLRLWLLSEVVLKWWEGVMNRWERAWWMRWDLPTTVCLTFEQGDRFTVGDSDRAGCNRSEHGCEKRDV